MASGNASFSLGLPSEKNSSSAELDAFFAAYRMLEDTTVEVVEHLDRAAAIRVLTAG